MMKLTVLLCVLAVGCAAHLPKAYVCRQGEACWPAAAQWQKLAAELDGKLLQPRSPLAPCREDATSAACATAMETLVNPYALQDDPGATQSLGWLDAWTAEPSTYAVAAVSARDIQAAVRFAREHALKLVIKGTGHDYLGRSSAPNSLLVWTHPMRRVETTDAFTPAGCPDDTPKAHALTAEAGTRWGEAYHAAMEAGRYVQGGGCLSVGVAGGFLQGGGFGTWSNMYGMAAGSLLEAHVVTADGELRIANACQNEDLYWALKGGGGGTYGVVTQVTLMTHELPTYQGFVLGEIEAADEAAYKELLERFFAFYDTTLRRPRWGEHVSLRKQSIDVTMSFADMSAEAATAIWSPFLAMLAAEPERFHASVKIIAVPGKAMWSDQFREQAAEAIQNDTRPDGKLFWWKTNQGEVATYWYAYTSRWLTAELFDDPKKLAAVMFDASRHWGIEVYFNKGQATVSDAARGRNAATSVNPVVHTSPALAIVAANADVGHRPDFEEGAEKRARVRAAMDEIVAATPGSGSYVNETDYFEPSWQRSFWGTNYEELLRIKRKYDPDNLFTCHHCVGSE